MNEEEEGPVFEIAVAVPKRVEKIGNGIEDDCVEALVTEFRNLGLIVERVVGLQNEIIKLAAPLKVIGKAAAELQLRKRTHIGETEKMCIVFILCNSVGTRGILDIHVGMIYLCLVVIGMDLPFQSDEVDAFVRQPDGSLFSWCERFCCYHHLMYETVNRKNSAIRLSWDEKVIYWDAGESLLGKLETEKIVKEVFPLHDEKMRKGLLKSWALNWWDFTNQPIDDICSYFGAKIATYFAFLGMYTRWLLFPAALGLVTHLVDFGSLQLLVLPVFFVTLITWSVMFFQFWKRKNAALLTRWQVYYPSRIGTGDRPLEKDLSLPQSPTKLMEKLGSNKMTEKQQFQREEWFGRLMRFRNDAMFVSGIICLQLPFELAYAHLYQAVQSDLLKFCLTIVYLFIIQYLTRLGGKVSVKLVKREKSKDKELRADSLVYKVFGLYFMQSYVGLFYHAFLHRDILTLRQVLVQRLIFSEVVENLLENSIPYLKYSFKKYRAVRVKRKSKEGTSSGKARSIPRVEKDFFKPTYSASIGEELEDGLFDDFLELALQFGMIMMFACAFPLAFAFAALNNITEIRADALKLLSTLRRPIPRTDASIGAWLNIFQFLIIMSICTNCVLLACLFDAERKWNISPGLAAILAMEHVLLLIKFGFSRIVPEEPAWVRANRMKNATQAQEACSKQLLRSISGDQLLRRISDRKMFEQQEEEKDKDK